MIMLNWEVFCVARVDGRSCETWKDKTQIQGDNMWATATCL
jgi:hypothetical protein